MPYKDKEKQREAVRKWYRKNRDKILNKEKEKRSTNEYQKRKKKYYDNNRTEILQNKKEYFLENRELIKEKNKKHYYENRNEILEKKKQYGIDNRKKILERNKNYEAKRNAIDPSFKLRRILRSRILTALKNINKRKENSCIELVGCSLLFLKKYIESKFLDGMSWENHGKWHIDHICPCASFNLALIEEQKKCFHYTNLQPLWAIDNIRKGSKILLDKETDTIPDVNGHDSPIAITKITLAHHKEDKDYYVKLKKAMPNG
jgi:hypothetical protein